MISVSVSTCIFCDSTRSRSISPSGVPPGSRVTTTCRPLARKRSAIKDKCVLLPAPSIPSRVMNFPWDIYCCRRW